MTGWADFCEDIKPFLMAEESPATAALKGKLSAGELSLDALNQSQMLQLSGSVEIMALTVPSVANHSTSVSMYFNLHAPSENVRATRLAHACGHTQAAIRGDAFVSRVIDDEPGDIWKRIDILEPEVAPDAQWVIGSRRKGMGGGHGGAGSSVSGTLMGMAYSTLGNSFPIFLSYTILS